MNYSKILLALLALKSIESYAMIGKFAGRSLYRIPQYSSKTRLQTRHCSTNELFSNVRDALYHSEESLKKTNTIFDTLKERMQKDSEGKRQEIDALAKKIALIRNSMPDKSTGNELQRRQSLTDDLVCDIQNALDLSQATLENTDRMFCSLWKRIREDSRIQRQKISDLEKEIAQKKSTERAPIQPIGAYLEAGD